MVTRGGQVLPRRGQGLALVHGERPGGVGVRPIHLAGVVIDGGAKLNQAENANAIAQEAARAGAGLVNPANAYSTGSFTVDQGQALAAARQYLAAAGYHGTVIPVGTESIHVTVTVTAPTRVLSIIGIDSMSSTGSATASLVAGVTGPGR